MATAKGVIKNINTDQHRILADIMTLYCPQGYECDPTYSIGNFYGKFKWVNDFNEDEEYEIPQPRYKFDVRPQTDGVEKLEVMGRIPLDDNSLSSMVVDMPFVISCGPSMENEGLSSNIISRRFACFYPVADLVRNYYHILSESYRILDNEGILVWKCQRTITGSKSLNSPEMSWMFAESLGFDCIDQFFLHGKNRLISGKIKKQQHSRSYISVFYVFKKSLKKKVDYLTCFDEETRNKIMLGLSSNNIKDGRKFLSEMTRQEEITQKENKVSMTRERAYENLKNYVEYECYNGHDVPDEYIDDEIRKIEEGCYNTQIF